MKKIVYRNINVKNIINCQIVKMQQHEWVENVFAHSILPVDIKIIVYDLKRTKINN